MRSTNVQQTSPLLARASAGASSLSAPLSNNEFGPFSAHALKSVSIGPNLLSINAEVATSPFSITQDAFKAQLGYNRGHWGLEAGYRRIEPRFTSLNYVTSIGSFAGVSNMDGAELIGSYNLSDNLSVQAGGRFYRGLYDENIQGTLAGVNDVNSAAFGLKYGITSSSMLDFGYEWVQWNVKNDLMSTAGLGKPSEQCITVGLRHNIGRDAAIKLFYQVSDYKDNGSGLITSSTATDEGEALVGEASIKF